MTTTRFRLVVSKARSLPSRTMISDSGSDLSLEDLDLVYRSCMIKEADPEGDAVQVSSYLVGLRPQRLRQPMV